MARLRSSGSGQPAINAAIVTNVEEAEESSSDNSSDIGSGHGNDDVEEDGDHVAYVPSSDDPASKQLIMEHSRGAACVEEDITDSVKVAALQDEASQHFSESIVDSNRGSAIEHARLLNAARQQPTTRRNDRTHNVLPIRPTRNANPSEPDTRKLKAVMITQPLPKGTGKLQRPTKTVERPSKSPRPVRRKPYKPPSSLATYSHDAKIPVTPPKTKVKRHQAVEQNDAPVEFSPPSRKSKRVAGEDISVEPAPPGEIVEKVVQKRQGEIEKRRSAALDNDDDEAQSPLKRGRGRPPKSHRATKTSSEAEDSVETKRERSSRNSGDVAKAPNKANLATDAQDSKDRRRRPQLAGPGNQPDCTMEAVEQSVHNMNLDPSERIGNNSAISPSPLFEPSTSGHQESLQSKRTKSRTPHGERLVSSTAPDLDAVLVEEGEDDETAVEEDRERSDDEDDDDIDFLGERSELQKVFSVKVRKIPLQTETGSGIREAYLSARALFVKTETDYGDDLDVLMDERDAALTNLRESLRSVEHEEFKDAKDELVVDLYARIFPLLARLLGRIWMCYTTEDTDNSLPDKCLNIAIPFIKMVLSLDDTIKNWKERPDVSLAIVRPVKHNIIGPLRKVLKLLQDEKHRRHLAEANLEQQRSTAAAIQRREELDDRLAEESRQRAMLKRVWIDLHIVRMSCEPDDHLVRRLKNKTRVILPNDHKPKIERDADGNPFERVDGLGAPRTCRPPAATARVGPEWTDEERKALTYALERFAGPLVYQNTFRKYCRPGGPLRKYTVVDIVEEAMYLRTKYMEWDLADGKQPEDWIVNIPVFHWVEER